MCHHYAGSPNGVGDVFYEIVAAHVSNDYAGVAGAGQQYNIRIWRRGGGGSLGAGGAEEVEPPQL